MKMQSVSTNGGNPESVGVAGRRINGLQMPWDILQMITWLLFPIILTQYYAFLYFLLWDYFALKIFLTALFSLLALSSSISGYLTCSIDPADDSLCSNPRNSTSSHERVDSENNNSLYCYICETNVHITSKHCRFCDKCVVNFDHHCKWLNTCIGRKNYRYFLVAIFSLLLLVTESSAISIALTIESFAYSSLIMDRVDDNFSSHLGSDASLAVLRGLLLTSSAVLLGLVAMLVQLTGFHVNLLWNGITTYDFIVQEQKKTRDKEAAALKAKAEKKQQRRNQDLELSQSVAETFSDREANRPNEMLVQTSEEI